MINVLIISGHTDLSASVANKTILDTVHKELPEAEIVTGLPESEVTPLVSPSTVMPLSLR